MGLFSRLRSQHGEPRAAGLEPLSILPPPFEWCEIPAGRTALSYSEPGNVFNMLSRTFEVNPFRMAKYPITYAQFQVFIDAPDGFGNPQWWQALQADDVHVKHPGDQAFKSPARPRENVSWYDAVAFCRWLSEKLTCDVRLPTEWEWQWAAQGGDGRDFPWGNEFSERACNMIDSGNGEETTPVDRYPMGASRFGVLDMAGNVFEWCLNTYDPPFSTSLDGSMRRAIRGGSFNSVDGWVTTTYRGGGYDAPPDRRDRSMGFRVANFS